MHEEERVEHEPVIHLWNAGEAREKESAFRWAFGHANELPRHLGIVPPRGWWCGFFLRREVFGPALDGDVVAAARAPSSEAHELVAA